jgi:hypothetical protein
MATTRAVKTSCKNTKVRSASGSCVSERPSMKKGGVVKDKKWIQKAINPAHKGFCTPLTKKTCTPKRKALAITLKKIAKKK